MVAPGLLRPRRWAPPTSPRLARLLRDGAARAPTGARWPTREHEGGRRARSSARSGDALADTRLHPIRVRAGRRAGRVRDRSRARCALDDMVALHHRTCRARVGGRRPGASSYNYVSTLTQLSPRALRLLRGRAHRPVLRPHPGHGATWSATGPSDSQEIYDVVGHQRGWEILTGGVARAARSSSRRSRRSPWPWRARAVELAAAPRPAHDRARGGRGRHRSALQHAASPTRSSATRSSSTAALKMETAYAGRSWLLARPRRHQVGQRIASPLVTAYSDPVAARLRPLRLRPRGHAGPAGRPHRPRASSAGS